MSAAVWIPSAATREDVVREALSWLDCPFHDMAGVKGAGVDCAYLLVKTYSALGLVEDFDPKYPPQWFQHRGEPIFLQMLEKYAHRVEVAQPGDVAMFNFGRHAAHGAIVIDTQSMVHAYKPAGRVILDSRRSLAHCFDSYWSYWAAIP
jgi:cell wall-associated NlpC family hydrolase